MGNISGIRTWFHLGLALFFSLMFAMVTSPFLKRANDVKPEQYVVFSLAIIASIVLILVIILRVKRLKSGNTFGGQYRVCWSCKQKMPRAIFPFCPSCQRTHLDKLREGGPLPECKHVAGYPLKYRKELFSQLYTIATQYNNQWTIEQAYPWLLKLMETLGLKNSDINYRSLMWPVRTFYDYKITRQLPVLPPEYAPIPLRQNEVVHFSSNAVLIETVIETRYRGKSRGIGIAVTDNIAIGGSREHGRLYNIPRETETSRGTLILSNQRVFLAPLGGFKPLEIPLSNLVHQEKRDNGVKVFTSTNNFGFIFVIDEAARNVFYLFINHILSNR